MTIHVDLNDLRGGSVLERSWTPALAAAGPGSVYLTGAAAEAAACDAVLTTVVTGQIDWQALDQLTGLWLTLHTHAPGDSDSDGQAPSDSQDPAGSQAPGDGGGQPSSHSPGNADRHGGRPGPGDSDGNGQAHGGDDSGGGQAIPRGPLPETRARLQATLLQACINVVSGPGGVASYLRGALLNAPFSSLSQPLDIGRTTRTIPPHLRTAVILRDKHCQFPGCRQPPSVCEVHHLIHVGPRRPHQPGQPGLVLPVPPSHRHPPLGLEHHPPPRRHPHRHRTRRQNPALPQPTQQVA